MGAAPPRLAGAAVDDIAVYGFTYGAAGVSAGAWGALAFGHGLVGNDSPVLGGGGVVWGAPIDRLTLVAEAQRNVMGEFSPSGAVLFRAVGDRHDGLVLSALAKLKLEGFGRGPRAAGGEEEVESELEAGVLLGHAAGSLHLDLDGIVGFGLGDDGEVDVEIHARVGYDVSSMVRLGVDGQFRARAAGTFKLPGDRTADFVAGPEIVVSGEHFFGALVTGPATLGVVDANIGWLLQFTFGGVL